MKTLGAILLLSFVPVYFLFLVFIATSQARFTMRFFEWYEKVSGAKQMLSILVVVFPFLLWFTAGMLLTA